MKKKSLSLLIAVAMATTMVPSTMAFADTTAPVEDTQEPTEVTKAPASTYEVDYSTHVQNIGWQKAVKTVGDEADLEDVTMAGTEGKGLRLEAIKISGANLPKGASITYKAHSQNKGWMDAVTTEAGTPVDEAEMAGTKGEGLRLEALRLTLNGMPGYALKVSVHVQNKGWMKAVTIENGSDLDKTDIVGTEGEGLRLEGIKIQIVKTDAEKTAEVAAINAVAKAEATKTAEDIEEAKRAVDAVNDATVKAEQTAKIEAITGEDPDQPEKTEEAVAKEAVAKLVEAANGDLSTEEAIAAAEDLVAPAKEAVEKVEDEEVKADLTAQIESAQELIDVAKEELVDKKLKVESVNADNKTIEINVAALEPEEKDKANVEIFKLNEDGEKVTPSTLKATNLSIEDGKVVFDVSSKKLGDADYLISVSIGKKQDEVKVEVKFDEVEKLVEEINKATAAQLAKLLDNAEYFTGFNIDNVDAYYAEKGKIGTCKTIVDVQEKIINVGEEKSNFAAFVDNINNTKGTFAKYTLLKDTFEYVDDANMDEYMKDITGLFNSKGEFNATSFDSFEDVQDKIDTINLDAVVKAGIGDSDIATSKPSKLESYKVALETLQLSNDNVKDSTSSKKKIDIIDEIDSALETINDAREKADQEIEKAQKSLDAYEVANGGVPEEGAVNEYDTVIDEIAALQKDDLTATELSITNLTAAIKALDGKTSDLTILQEAKDAMSNFETAYKELNDKEYTNGVNTVYDNVKNHVTTLESDPTDSGALTALKNTSDNTASVAGLKEQTRQIVLVKKIISTTDSSEMKSLLLQLTATTVGDEVSGRKPYDAFVNLSSAAKVEFAQYVIDNLATETDSDKDEYKELTNKIFGDSSADDSTEKNGYYSNYSNLIKAVNDARNISDMKDKLDALNIDAYDALDDEAKLDVADKVLQNKGDTFKTIAEIEEAMGL